MQEYYHIYIIVGYARNNTVLATKFYATTGGPISIPNPFDEEKIKCLLCRNEITPDYKNVKLLSQFQSPYTGRIYGRHITGLCKNKQAEVEREIAKSQSAGYMPAYHKFTEFLKDPKICDPERPVRPHKY